jgi:hypothetical protein
MTVKLDLKLLTLLVATLAVGFLLGFQITRTEQVDQSVSLDESIESKPQQDVELASDPPAITFATQNMSEYDASKNCGAGGGIGIIPGGIGPFMKDPAFNMTAFANRAAEDPQNAFEEGVALWERGEGGKAYYVALCYWTRRDPSAAFQYTYSIENETVRMDAQVQILSRLSQSDPKSVALAIRSLPSDSRFSRIVIGAYDLWAKQDIDGAAISALEITDDKIRLPILRQITRQWLKTDFESATAFIVSINDRKVRQELAYLNAQEIIAFDSHLAMSIAHDADADEKLFVSKNYIPNLANKNPGLVFDSIQSRYNAREQRLLMEVFLLALMRKDAALAAKYVDRLPKMDRDNYYELVGRNWARNEPGMTVAWLEKAGSPGSRAALANIGPVVAHHDVTTAMNLTASIPPDLQFRWINSITETLAEDDPAAAYQWLQQFVNHESYPGVVELQGARILESDIEAGVDLILQIPVIEKRAKLASIYIRYVAARNPAAAALLWTVTATQSNERHMMADLMREWTQIDSSEAKSWIRNLDDSQSRDMAILTYANFSTDASESLVLLCVEIENEHKRKRQIADLISAAESENIDNILGLLREANLSDDEELWYRAHARDVKTLRSLK